MNTLSRLYHSSLGKKYVMAVTGLILFLYVVAHMLGNLQIFLGRDPINSYAELLKSKPALLWTARLALLVAVTLHVTSAIQLALANRRARPVGYHDYEVVASTFAARTILISGLIIFAFVIYHLAHFTFGFVDPRYLSFEDSHGRHDVYRMVVTGFSNPIVSGFYIISMGLLCLHLSHGASSLFQSLGLKSKAWVRLIDRSAKTAAVVIFLGNVSMPLAILAGLVK
jgi:succinate dehydrogenase cytochrome b subunit